MMNEKTTHFVLLVNMAIIIAGSIIGLYWYFLAERILPVYTFYNDIQNLETDKDFYEPGDAIVVNSSFCKNRSGQVTTSWSLVDTYVRTYPTKHSQLDKGCFGVPEDQWVKIVDLPPELPAGDYFLQGVSSTEINPLKTVEYRYKTKPFKVL